MGTGRVEPNSSCLAYEVFLPTETSLQPHELCSDMEVLSHSWSSRRTMSILKCVTSSTKTPDIASLALSFMFFLHLFRTSLCLHVHMWIPIKDTEGQIHCILEAFTAVFSNAKKESLTFKSFWTRTSHLPTICRGTEKESSGCHVCTQGFLGLLVLTIELPPVVQPEYLYKSESPEHRFRHCNVVEITKLHNQSAESHIL